MIFTHSHYVPILKGKLGEYRALQQLYPQDRASLTPLIEIPPVDWDWDNDVARKAEIAHLEANRDNMIKYWGTTDRLFVDLVDAELSIPVVGDSLGRHPYGAFFDLARSKGLLAIPVVPPSPDAMLLSVVKAIVSQDQRGLMVRVGAAALANVSALQTLPATFGLQPSQIDLLIDLGEVNAASLVPYQLTLPQLLPQIPNLQSFRSFCLAGCSFPETLSAFVSGQPGLAPRIEWALWTAVVAALPPTARPPTHSDYGISHSEIPDLDPRIMSPSNNIRYTVAANWVIVKGQGLKKKKAGQPTNQQMCQYLIGRPDYCGQQFSDGDQYIMACATGQGGPGNLTTWRQMGTNHHLTFVVRQIASAVSPSVPAVPGPAALGGGTSQ